MTITDLIAFAQGQHWLALIALSTLVVRKWCSAASSFPVTIPQRWRGTVTAAGGLLYGLVSALQGGAPLGAAALGMALAAGAGGFLDGLLVAIFDHDAAPNWARAIVFIFDDLTTSASPSAPAPVTPPVVPTPINPPVDPPPAASPLAATARMTTTFVGLAALVMVLAGCGTIKVRPSPAVPIDSAEAIACVVTGLAGGLGFDALEAKCLPGQRQLLVDILDMLTTSSKLAEENPEAAHNAPLVLQMARQQGYRPTGAE
jgi:hypothetical protein